MQEKITPDLSSSRSEGLQPTTCSRILMCATGSGLALVLSFALFLLVGYCEFRAKAETRAVHSKLKSRATLGRARRSTHPY